jgi:hypothetical protein
VLQAETCGETNSWFVESVQQNEPGQTRTSTVKLLPSQTNQHDGTTMSEYQYYEFQAIDRPLSNQEMRELRSYSTRAQITSTNFINEYHWGNFKGDEDDWMERYFDAFLYFANWGTRTLKLRVPAALLSAPEKRPYYSTQSFSIRTTNNWTILSFVSNVENGGGYEEEEDKPWEDDDDEWEDNDAFDGSDSKGVLSSLISIRSEIAQGDHRALYLGWLLAVQLGDIPPETEEPPVPPGLTNLSASQRALVTFLRMDLNLLVAAAEHSAPMPLAVLPDDHKCLEWLAKVPVAEKDKWLVRVMRENAITVSAEMTRQFQKAYASTDAIVPATIGRTAEELLDRAHARAEERMRIARERAEQRLQDEANARVKYLDSLIGQENTIWTNVEKLAATKLPNNYDAAVKLLLDLRDAAKQSGNDHFQSRFAAFRAVHARKTSLIERIQKANL